MQTFILMSFTLAGCPTPNSSIARWQLKTVTEKKLFLAVQLMTGWKNFLFLNRPVCKHVNGFISNCVRVLVRLHCLTAPFAVQTRISFSFFLSVFFKVRSLGMRKHEDAFALFFSSFFLSFCPIQQRSTGRSPARPSVLPSNSFCPGLLNPAGQQRHLHPPFYCSEGGVGRDYFWTEKKQENLRPFWSLSLCN